MSQLSTSVTRWLLDWLEGHSISAAAWTEGICDPEVLLDEDGTIPWSVFLELCDRLAEFSEEPPDGALAIPSLVEIGREIAEEILNSGEGPAASAELPLELIFVESLPAFASAHCPDFEVQADMASDGEVVLYQITLPNEDDECPAFFALIQGMLEAVPAVVGHDPGDVAMDIQPGSARVAIRIPDAFENVIPLATADDELGLEEASIDLDFDLATEEREFDVLSDSAVSDEDVPWQVETPPTAPREAELDGDWHEGATVGPESEARTPLDNETLELVAYQQVIAGAEDLDGVVGALFDSLREGFGCRAARLTLDGGETGIALDPFKFGRLGRASKPPQKRFAIRAAGRTLGELEVWRKTPLAEAEVDAIESRLPIAGLGILATLERASGTREESDAKEGEREARADTLRAALLSPLLDNRLIEAGDPLGAVASALLEGTGAHTTAISVRATSQPMQLRTLVCWRQSGRGQPFEYDATGTPCAEVLSGQILCVPRDAETSFPALVHAPVDATASYLGAPLRDRHGEVIGVLAMWGSDGIEADDAYRDVIRLLADRAEVEISRQRLAAEVETQTVRRDAIWGVSHDILVEWHSEQNKARVSPNVEAVLGYTPEQFVALEVQDVIHVDDRAALDAAFKRGLAQDEPLELPIRLIDAGGNSRAFSLRMSLDHEEASGTRVAISLRDEAGARALRHERDRLFSIIEHSSDLIALYALQGNVLSMNESGQRMLGLASEEEARGKTIHDFTHPEAARAMKFEILPAVHRRSQWEGEVDLRHGKTEEAIRVETRMFMVTDRVTSKPLAIAMLARDTTAIRERDRALLESEERYRMLAENPYELIAELDRAGHFIFASANFEAVLGRSPESLLGNFAIDLVHPDDRAQLEQHFEGLPAEGGTAQFDFRIEHLDGHYRWFEATFRTYLNSAGRMMTVAIARDITDRVESSEALRQTQHKLQQSQKMEAIGRMAGGVAHDFNNLLTAITGYCDLLLEDLGEQHPARTDAEEILKASERAAGLTHQLLAFSRRQVLQPRIVDMNNLVADLDRMLRRLIGEDVELVTVLDGTAWPTKADPGQLHQVLLNLVVNSRDAMPRGGRITIETANECVEQPLQTDFDEIPTGDYVTLKVKDTGTGMSPEIVSMIFEPFFTTKDSGKGTGLGLSTVIGIVQQTGGYIRVDSAVGRGTTFIIYLPRAEGVAMLPEHNATPAQFDGHETVMVVEDSEPVRNLVVRCLERHGYAVLQAGSGAEALKLANRHEGPIELFLCDVILPKMDGIELSKRVKSVRPDSGVIFMSGFTDDGLAKHGVEAADIALLEKPFTPSTLLRTVREYLDEGTVPVPPTRTLPEDDQVH